MKKCCFLLFLCAALCFFFLFSCTKVRRLYDVVADVTEESETLPAGSVFCYGRAYPDPADAALVGLYVGLDASEVFGKVEDFAVYSALPHPEYELLLCRFYRASDLADGKAALEKRAKETDRALRSMGIEPPEYAVCAYGNTAVLCRMPDNAAALRTVKAGA